MPELKISEKGLVLEGPGVGNLSGVPTQTFPLMISDDVIAAMIRCVQEDGEEIRLSLGTTPTLHYGSSSQPITPPPEDFSYDVYLTKPFEHTRLASRVPQTMSILKTPFAHAAAVMRARSRQPGKTKATKPTKPLPANAKGSASSGVDSDIEALQSSMAAAEASKSQTGSLSKKPGTKGNKLLATTGSARSTPRPHASSPPGISAQASPSLNPVSATQQAVEHARRQRFEVVHELAIQDQMKEYLKSKFKGADMEFGVTLDKVADYNAETKTFSMSKQYWKELDPWAYDYDSHEDRQKAIENAVKQYDRMRMAESEPAWQKLLPAEERGKGKCLGTLQKKVARGQAAPKIQVQADDGEMTPREMMMPVDDKPKAGKAGKVENMSRSLASKAKKSAPTDAQLEKLLVASTKKTAVPKVAPLKVKDGVVEKTPLKKDDSKGKKVLSAEMVEDSDSGDEEALAKPRIGTKTKATSSAAKAKSAAAKAAARAPPPVKRPREDGEDDSAIANDSSSASSTPLGKRLKAQPKQKLLPTAASGRHGHGASDASQGSKPALSNGTSARNGTANGYANTSPAKSSPLASSPPTNASDLEHDTARDRDRDRRRELERSRDREREWKREREHETARDTEPGKKRKAGVSDGPPTKKQRLPSNETMEKALRFKSLYQKYFALHNEISSMSHPPSESVEQLHKMHTRLATLKSEIYSETADL